MDRVELKIWKSPGYALTEAFRTLRTNIQFCGDDIKSIVFTSFGENEGKSTIVVNLARSMAETGKSVLVIDSDIRKSVMIRELKPRTENGKNIYGLSHFLSGQRQVEDVIYEVKQQPNLHMIFSGPYVPNSAELLGNRYMERLIKYAKERYDFVLIDASPLGMVIDAAVLSTNCDGAVIVVSQGSCNRRQIAGIKRQLTQSGVKILGSVMNKVNIKRGGYYGHYYGKYYGKYGEYGNSEASE